MSSPFLLVVNVQSRNPILPAGNEVVWAVFSFAFLFCGMLLAALAVRYFVRLRRASEEAARRAAATQMELAALREELRRRPA